MSKAECVFLIGFSGSGKSTLGRLLAAKLKARYHDTDAIIEKRCGKSVYDIFQEDGEERFRGLETQIILELIARRSGRMVVALGGGAFQCPANRDAIGRAGLVAYLSCPVSEIYRRLRNKDDRPLLKIFAPTEKTPRQAAIARIKTLLEERKGAYELSDIKVSTARKTVQATVSELFEKVMAHGAQDRSEA